MSNFEVTPQAIIWIVGARNVVKVGKGMFRITSREGILLKRKETNEAVEVWTFSSGEHPEHPESVKVRRLWCFSKWVPMGEFTISRGEIPQDFLKEPGDIPMGDDDPVSKKPIENLGGGDEFVMNAANHARSVL